MLRILPDTCVLGDSLPPMTLLALDRGKDSPGTSGTRWESRSSRLWHRPGNLLPVASCSPDTLVRDPWPGDGTQAPGKGFPGYGLLEPWPGKGFPWDVRNEMGISFQPQNLVPAAEIPPLTFYGCEV